MDCFRAELVIPHVYESESNYHTGKFPTIGKEISSIVIGTKLCLNFTILKI